MVGAMALSRFCSVLCLQGLLAAALVLSACSTHEGSSAIGQEEGASAQLAEIKVNLPPPPTFEKEHAPEKYADGSLSVYGLRKDLKANLEKQAKVRGYIVEVYQCPACPKGQECRCDKPHLWIADRSGDGKDKALMVTGIPVKNPQTRRKMEWYTGVAYHFTGLFSRMSGTGFSDSDGLLVYEDAAPAVGE